MRKILSLIVLSGAALLALNGSASQSVQVQAVPGTWTSVGPEGGDIRGVAFNPSNKNILYALAYGNPSQVFKSTDSGQNWARIATIADYGYHLNVDPSNGNNLYVLGAYKIYKSTDGGTTWTTKNFPTNCYGYNGQIAVSRSNTNIVYASGYSYSGGYSQPFVYKSTDGGNNWTSKSLYSGSASSASTYCLAVDPNNSDIVYAGIYYYTGSASYNRIMKSTDGGNNWSDKTGSMTNTLFKSIVIDPTNSSKVYVGTGWAVYRSADGGNSWSANSGLAYAYALDIDASNPNTLYAGYIKECYKSTDGGVNWTRYSNAVTGTCAAMLVNGNKVYYASSAGVFRTDDAGGSWKTSQAGLVASQIPALCYAPSSANVVYIEVATNGFFKSTNFGTTWTRMPDFNRCEAVTRITVNPANVNDIYILAGG